MTEVREAATVMLVRDRPDLHVLLLRRTPGAAFGPGATVFPGGAVDPDDASPAVLARVVGVDDATASVEHDRPSGGLALRVAAARECFEEAGILLARDASSGAPVGGREALPGWRRRLNAGEATFAQLLAAEDLVLDARDLRVFSHWRTPVGAPRRYDTWFFLVPAPDGHEGVHDDNELVASAWMRPREALASSARGHIDLILPTRRSLEALARFDRRDALIGAADAAPRNAAGRPRVVTDGPGERIALHDDDDPVGGWTIPLPDRTFDGSGPARAGSPRA